MRLDRGHLGAEDAQGLETDVPLRAVPGWPTTLASLESLGKPGELSIKLIRAMRAANHRPASQSGVAAFESFAKPLGLKDELWAYPEFWFYGDVLSAVGPEDVVADVGAGNLALAVALSAVVRKVYAIEVNPLVVNSGIERIGRRMPSNLTVINTDAREYPLPTDVTCVVCLAIKTEKWPFPAWHGRRVIRARHGGADFGFLEEIVNFPDGLTRALTPKDGRRTSPAEVQARRYSYEVSRRRGGIMRTVINAAEATEGPEYWRILGVERPQELDRYG